MMDSFPPYKEKTNQNLNSNHNCSCFSSGEKPKQTEPLQQFNFIDLNCKLLCSSKAELPFEKFVYFFEPNLFFMNRIVPNCYYEFIFAIVKKNHQSNTRTIYKNRTGH
jgi:hypothetical protein